MEGRQGKAANVDLSMWKNRRTREEVAESMAKNIIRLKNVYARKGTLCDDPLFRNGDPPTSRLAGEGIRTKRVLMRDEFIDRLSRLPDGATAREIDYTDGSIRKRASELLRRGAIVVIGRRKCKVSGNLANVLQLSTRVGDSNE